MHFRQPGQASALAPFDWAVYWTGAHQGASPFEDLVGWAGVALYLSLSSALVSGLFAMEPVNLKLVRGMGLGGFY